jgi:hypothetical protein
MKKNSLLTILVVLLYLLHQDFWHWRVAEPIVFGLFPIGYFYHLVYTVVVSLVMWLLVRLAWPSHLEAPSAESPTEKIGNAGGRHE